MSLITLFNPILPKRAIPRVHVMEPDKKTARQAYEREYHKKHREQRLALMKARYEARKGEYIRKAKEWAEKNPDKRRQITRNHKLRARLKA